jgi:hypothetical protein
MLISPQGRIQIAAASIKPAADAVGHPLVYLAPFYFPIAEQVWAISLETTGVDVPVVVSATARLSLQSR